MNNRNSTAKRKENNTKTTRKKREELSVYASKSIKKENVEIGKYSPHQSYLL